MTDNHALVGNLKAPRQPTGSSMSATTGSPNSSSVAVRCYHQATE